LLAFISGLAFGLASGCPSPTKMGIEGGADEPTKKGSAGGGEVVQGEGKAGSVGTGGGRASMAALRSRGRSGRSGSPHRSRGRPKIAAPRQLRAGPHMPFFFLNFLWEPADAFNWAYSVAPQTARCRLQPELWLATSSV
jgi:hypothetical protein